jgi:hypothetical protein
VSDPLRRLELARSLRNNPRRTAEDLLRFRETAAQLRTGLTASQRDLKRYIPAEVERDDEERERVKPLAFLFNLLQTGQYVSANIAQEIKDSRRTGVDLSEEAKDGPASRPDYPEAGGGVPFPSQT